MAHWDLPRSLSDDSCHVWTHVIVSSLITCYDDVSHTVHLIVPSSLDQWHIISHLYTLHGFFLFGLALFYVAFVYTSLAVLFCSHTYVHVHFPSHTVSVVSFVVWTHFTFHLHSHWWHRSILESLTFSSLFTSVMIYGTWDTRHCLFSLH